MLEVITGCMYSGKSEELIRRLRRCQIAGQTVVAFKSGLDDRYSMDIATHPIEGVPNTLSAEPVCDSKELVHRLEGRFVPGCVIGVDEVQFMDPDIVGVLDNYASHGVRVIVAGLDLDASGKPFGPMAELLAVADKVDKLTAVCIAPVSTPARPSLVPTPPVPRCGKPATRSYRLPDQDSGEQVQVGSAGMYEARCRACWARGRR